MDSPGSDPKMRRGRIREVKHACQTSDNEPPLPLIVSTCLSMTHSANPLTSLSIGIRSDGITRLDCESLGGRLQNSSG